MLFNEARATALLREAGIDAIVAAAQLSVDYLTDHRSSFESTFRRYHMIPGAGPELLFRSFALAAAGGGADARRARRDRRHRPARVERRLEIYGAAGFAAEAAEAPDGPFRELAATLARGSADVTALAALGRRSAKPCRRAAASRSSAPVSPPRTRRAARAAARHRAERRVGTAPPHPDGQDGRRDRALA